MNNQVHIIGGGTVFHIRPHLALCAPVYGRTAWDIAEEVAGHTDFDGQVHLYTTKMAGDYYQATAIDIQGETTCLEGCGDCHSLETNEDVACLIDNLVADPAPKILFMPVALCDFDVVSMTGQGQFAAEPEDQGVGKHLPRLKSLANDFQLNLEPSEKVIQRVRKTRKDIFLVAFKTTTGASPQEMFNDGLKLLNGSSCNLVLVNDLETRLNLIVTPEQAPYALTKDRGVAIATLVDMALSRAQGHFTRSKIVEGPETLVRWTSEEIPANLREVVNHCIEHGAYKEINGKTVGHFAARRKPGDNMSFLTSMRGVNFNKLPDPNSSIGLVQVDIVNDNEVKAYGAKPSVGGQSQRRIFTDHPEMDYIVHFHCPLRPGMEEFFPIRPQYPHECGSHECGQNTSEGLVPFLHGGEGVIKAVMLDNHGPNIVFGRDVAPKLVTDFIDRHWDLSRSTSEVTV
jgi:hypothetical protein